MKPSFAALAVFSGILAACIQPPDVIVADRETALERQASGTYRALERDLRRAAVSGEPAAYTRGQLHRAGVDAAGGEMGSLLRIYSSVRDDADRVDELLVQGCIGEGAGGLLVETPDRCAGAADVEGMRRVLQRANRSRRQVWTWLSEQRPEASDEMIRTEWRRRHLETVVCGAPIQGADGAWEVAACE